MKFSQEHSNRALKVSLENQCFEAINDFLWVNLEWLVTINPAVKMVKTLLYGYIFSLSFERFYLYSYQMSLSAQSEASNTTDISTYISKSAHSTSCRSRKSIRFAGALNVCDSDTAWS